MNTVNNAIFTIWKGKSKRPSVVCRERVPEGFISVYLTTT